jgi:hypothetical protein
MHDSEYWLKREAEARAAAARRRDSDDADVAGHLALAYATLARRHKQAAPEVEANEQPLPVQD